MKTLRYEEEFSSSQIIDLEDGITILPIANVTFESKYSDCIDGLVFGVSVQIKLKGFSVWMDKIHTPMSIETAKEKFGLDDSGIAICEKALVDELIDSDQIVLQKIKSFKNLLTIEGQWSNRTKAVAAAMESDPNNPTEEEMLGR